MSFRSDLKVICVDNEKNLDQCYPAPMSSSISAEEVGRYIEKFWKIMCGNSTERLEELYSANALVLTGKAKKPEPAHLAIERRMRQVREPAGGAVSELGSIEIDIPVPGVAVTSYTYKFHRKGADQSGGVVKRHTMFGRATQIFQQDAEGKLRIVHEHLSAAANPEVEKSPAS
jgi:ketosteroid isomerase-like protein